MTLEKRDLAIIGFLSFSILPVFTDPFHQKTEKIIFWEWAGKELWELYTGIELALKRLKGERFQNAL